MSRKEDTGWNGKSKANGLAYRIFLFVLQNGGIWGAYTFLYFVTAWFFFFDRKSNRYTHFYYREIWGFGWFKTLRYTYMTYYRFGQSILDKVTMLAGNTDQFDIEFDGHHLLEEMAEDDQGGILISAHIGNWEIAGHFLKNAKRPVNVVMYDVERPEVKNVLSESLKNRAFKIIEVKSDYSHLLEIRKAIENREFICMHGDRMPEKHYKRFETVDFLGRPVNIPLGPFDLAVRFNVPYMYVFAVKNARLGYHFQAFKPDPAIFGDFHAMVEEYVGIMEQILEAHPEQWFNFYDYWGIDRPKEEFMTASETVSS